MNDFNPVLLHGKIMVPGNPSVFYSGGLSIIELYKIKLCCSVSGAYMSFQCPSCSNKKSLKIIESIELPPDSRSDEISLQVVRCSSCNYLGLAVYEESSRGALGSETVDHYGYLADQKISKSVQSMIKRCPKPRNARCKCTVHQELNNRDKSGRWLRPGLEAGQQTYPMKM